MDYKRLFDTYSEAPILGGQKFLSFEGFVSLMNGLREPIADQIAKNIRPKKGKYYVAEYLIGNNTYMSYIYAKNWKDAEEIAERRNIGETIQGTSEVSQRVEVTNFDDLIHYVTFVGYVGCKSGTVTIDQLMGDKGVAHEILHYRAGELSKEELTVKLNWLFDNVEGFERPIIDLNLL